MLDAIFKSIVQAGGRPFEVGGCVRDRLYGVECKDVDIEVFDLRADALVTILSSHGRVDCVGVSFGVIKFKPGSGVEYDFTLPRRESKSGRGHRGFLIEVDHSMTIEEAAARRDFTINAIYRCPITNKVIDPFGGAEHLRQRLLHCTSSHFGEDPLRVLRGMQFAGRFDLSATESTLVMCRELLGESQDLTKDRFWAEWEKWAWRSRRPSRGLRFLQESHWLKLFPELFAIFDTRHEGPFPSEGDSWTNTLVACDAAAAIAQREQLGKFERVVLLLATLCHDLGRNSSNDCSGSSPLGHQAVDEDLARSFLDRIGCPTAIRESVVTLVANRFAHQAERITRSNVRRLSVRLAQSSIRQLIHLIESRAQGQSFSLGWGASSNRFSKNAKSILEIAEQLAIDRTPPKPLVLGRHLIAMGCLPSPSFGCILNQCFEAQLDGDFGNEIDGIVFLRQLLALRNTSS